MTQQKKLISPKALKVRANQVYDIPPLQYYSFMYTIEHQSKDKKVIGLDGKYLSTCNLDVSKKIDYIIAKRVLINSIMYN